MTSVVVESIGSPEYCDISRTWCEILNVPPVLSSRFSISTEQSTAFSRQVEPWSCVQV